MPVIFRDEKGSPLTSAEVDENFRSVLGSVNALAVQKGAPSGLATLDVNGKVPVSQMPTQKMGIGKSVTTGLSVIDMHFKTLRGTGWVNGEGGGLYGTSTVQPGTINDSYLIVNPALSQGFVIGQLVCYVGDDGLYHTAVITAIEPGGTVLYFDRLLAVSVGVGRPVYNFYNEGVHPNLHGYRSIADDAHRQLSDKYETCAEVLGYGSLSAIAGAVLEPSHLSMYSNPGGNLASEDNATRVTTSGANQGVESQVFDLPAGQYSVSFVVNSGYGATPLRATLQEIALSGAGYQVDFFDVPRQGGMHQRTMNIKTRKGSKFRLRFMNTDPNANPFVVGKIVVSKKIETQINYDFGTHVLLGDSWFYQSGIFERLQALYPNATFINKGVGGDQALSLYIRADADVKPYNPDFVWVMCGTNDAYADKTPELFEVQMNLLFAKLIGYGAQVIAFNASVGNLTYTPAPGPRLNITRAYAIRANYQDWR